MTIMMTTKMVMIMMIAMMADKGTTISCLPASLNVVKMMAMMTMMLVQMMMVDDGRGEGVVK